VKKLLAWKHPGFSAHVGETIAPTDKLRLEDTAAYLVRNPLSLRKLVYLDGIGSEAPATRTIVRRKLAKHTSRESVARPPGRA
jgi:hypothetical protein